MANTKDKHYWAQLRAALTAGEWSSVNPAKAPNGTVLPWSELLRKFNKHCRGFTDIAEIASQTRTLALLLRSNSENDDQDDICEGSVFPVSLGSCCMLPEERMEEADAGYEALKKLECSNFDTLNFALAYYAYALGKWAECISYLENIPDVVNIASHIPSVPNSTRSGAQGLQIPAPGTDNGSSNSWTGSFISDISNTLPEIKDGKAWSMTETLRGICLRGMSHEKLLPENPEKALVAYDEALSLIGIIQLELITAPTSSSGVLDFSTFIKFRELWRWVDIIFWRAIVLYSRISDVHDANSTLWTWFSQYSSCSVLWPARFRTQHRATISTLYLRALICRAPSAVQPWLSTARSVINDYREILSFSTTFPRAGERNIKVEQFVDLCVAIWEASGGVGDQAGWVIDVLWWATRLTFNSYRILRHMTRLYYLSGDSELSKHTLRLYTQIVGKAAQTTTGGDIDSDRNWVLTLAEGAMMLCRLASQHQTAADGIVEAREAVQLAEKARLRLPKADDELNARVDLAEGVAIKVLALTEQESRKRDTQLVQAHSMILRAVQRHSTPLAHFHLSLSFAQFSPEQDLQAAIIQAGLAVEGEPKEIQYWHLLGLLLAASESWDEASEALEHGALISEEPQEEDVLPSSGLPAPEDQPISNLQPLDGLPPLSPSDNPMEEYKQYPPTFLLSKDDTDLPPGDNLLRPLLDHPSPSRHELFERALQLRMTQIAIAEYVDGPEAAEAFGVQVFLWTGKKREPNHRDQPRTSMSGSQPPESDAGHTINGNRKIQDPTEDHDNSTLEPVAEQSISIIVSHHPPDNADDEALAGPEDDTDETSPGLTTGDRSKPTKKVQQVQKMLKNHVNKGHATIKKIGNGVVKTGGSLRKANSAPDFHALLKNTSYQASSIHSRRRRLSSLIRPHENTVPVESPPPQPPNVLPPLAETQWNNRPNKERRLISDLWLMTAATFRRSGKIEQAKAAIMEAEVIDEDNPAVWVQLGLYYHALGRDLLAVETLQKAQFLSPDDVPAAVHLCRLYLTAPRASRRRISEDELIDPENVDLASGLLLHLTNGPGWDVPEAWYYLAKAYGMQGRRGKEKECLQRALVLSEKRGIREIQSAVGWCL